MIPVRLTFQGIYSYQKEQTIDFTRLTNAGLFGIFGHVGSGKSTILEAMSFALFNKIERLNGDKRNYNMMNLKSDKLFICFEFSANDGKSYRIEVSGRRNRKNFSDVPTFKRSLYLLQGVTWVPMADTTAEKITGLSYDNFHRTIIIPQGSFQEFLQLNVKERVTMLKELFNLNKYDLSEKTIALERENNERLQNLEGQLAQIGEIKPEDLILLKQKIVETQNSLSLLSEEQKKAQTREKTLEDLKKLSEELFRQKGKVASLKSAEPEFSSLEKEVREYETLYLTFQPELVQYNSLQLSLRKQTDELTGKKKEYDQSLNEILTKQTELEDLKPQFEKKEELLKHAEELNKLAQVFRFEETVKKINIEIQKEKDDLKALENKIINEKEISKQSIELLTVKKKDLPDLTLLNEVRNWFRDDKMIREQLKGEQSAIIQEIARLNGHLNDAFKVSDSLITVNETLDTFDPSLVMVRIEKAMEDAETNLRNLKPELSELEIQKRLETFAGELHEGKSCPLCGSKDHPHILDVHDVSEKLEMTRKREAELVAGIKNFTRGEKVLGNLVREISLTRTQIKTRQDNFDALNKKHEEHLKKFIWQQFEPEKKEGVEEEICRYNELSKEIGDLETKIDQFTKSLAGKEALRDDLTSKIRISDIKLTENKASIGLLEGQLAIVKRDDWTGRTLKDLETKSANLKREHQVISEKYKLLEDKVKEKRSLIDTLKGTIETSARQAEAMAEQKEQLSKRINDKLTKYGGLDLGYVEEVIKKDINLEKAKKDIASFRAGLEAAKSQLLKFETDLNGREYPEQEHKEIKDQLTMIRSRTAEINQEMGTLKNTLAGLEINLKTLEKLKKDQHALKIRSNNLTTLKNLFRGAAFVNFASRAYLENIVLAANVRFRRLTRQHLELVLDEDNNFMIRDHMNEGKQRSVKTLSGGQIFQASLSLALALADNVNHQVKADQNFFFLDEGFGSLDKESLGIVFETLKALRKENRIVGVISHVEEMQQEIDAHLIVSMDDAEGSTIRSSIY